MCRLIQIQVYKPDNFHFINEGNIFGKEILVGIQSKSSFKEIGMTFRQRPAEIGRESGLLARAFLG